MADNNPEDLVKQTAEFKIGKLNESLDNFENKLGLPSNIEPKNTDDVRKYLSMDRNQLESLSPAECIEISYILNSYALFIQRSYNKELAENTWAKKTMQFVASKSIGQFRGSFEQQELQAVRNDDFAISLLKTVNRTQVRMDRLAFISGNIKNIADTLKTLQQVKSYRTN